MNKDRSDNIDDGCCLGDADPEAVCGGQELAGALHGGRQVHRTPGPESCHVHVLCHVMCHVNMTSMSSCSFSYILSCHVQAAVGKDITKTDLVPAFQSLLKDCEAEVSGRTDSFYYCA